MFRRIIGIGVLSLLVSIDAWAQNDPSFSHYWAMEPAYNPAAVGKLDKINVVGAYNMSLTGFEHNPRTMYIAGDMPVYFLGAYHGLGGRVMNDQIGLFSHNSFALQYALKLKLFGGQLSIGGQAVLLSENFNGSKVELEEASDPAFTTSELTGSGFDMGCGLYYRHRNWYVGASVQHVMAPTIELGEKNELEVDRTYYFTAGCNIQLKNPFLSIQPTVLGRTDGIIYRADVTTRLKYTHESKMMYVGLGYSPATSVTVYLGGNFHGVTLGYSYEAFTNGLTLGNGSHELFVLYQTDLNLFKKGRNKHQSVRLL